MFLNPLSTDDDTVSSPLDVTASTGDDTTSSLSYPYTRSYFAKSFGSPKTSRVSRDS